MNSESLDLQQSIAFVVPQSVELLQCRLQPVFPFTYRPLFRCEGLRGHTASVVLLGQFPERATWVSATARHSRQVGSRRNDDVPALARTRIYPSRGLK